jgi:nucleoside 2-deoxyribosyltransferase
MQPFDGGTFDKRYEDVIGPAIRAAGIEAYRVDQDPRVSIPIQEIERGIRESQVCLAEITTDNPNVWFELGYAIACGREVVLVCSEERTTKFPFDVQHRLIITYKTASKSDFEKLGRQITERLTACLEKAETLSMVSEMSKLTTIEGLGQHEIFALAALAENIDHPKDGAPVWLIKRDMETSGFTKVAATIALHSLLKKNLIASDSVQDMNGDWYTVYALTESGWSWVLENQDRFRLQKPNEKSDDDMPF